MMFIYKSCCRRSNFGLVKALALVTFSAVVSIAASELKLANSSFESPSLSGEGKQATNQIADWKIVGTSGLFANNGSFGEKMQEADGAQLAYLNGAANNSLTQDLPNSVEPATSYTLTASVGLRKDSPLSKGASLFLRLQAIDTNTHSLIRTLAIQEAVVGRDPLSTSKLSEFTASFTSGATLPNAALRVLISVGDPSAGGKGDWTIDNIRLETRKPEVAGRAMPVPMSSIGAPPGAAAASAKPISSKSNTIHYNRDIRPILSENCFACHGPDSASRKGKLRLDRYDDATAPRKGSPAITPGKLDQSELVSRVTATDPDEVMPPPKTKKKLTPEQIDLLKKWVAQGAQYELHWSLIPPSRPPLPAVKNGQWARNPVDRFILANLEKQGLKPAPEADRRTLARRVSLDLTGLPPSPEAVNAFVNDKRSDAYEQFVDNLMNSEAWGEHRARYWLDVARYADTHGIHFDNFREMWSYREWVIKAFNSKMPFDQFTVEQLAGDLLPNPTLEQRIASGFNRCNITTAEGGIIDEEYLVLYARDRTETASAIWMGLTANCCTCHDHKFDPLTQREFYQMSAFFNNNTAKAKDDNRNDPPPTLVVPTPDDRQRWFALPKEIPAAKERVDARRKAARPDFDKSLPGVKPDLFAKEIPAKGLTFHAPLTEGEGTNVSIQITGRTETVELGTNILWGSGYIAEKSFKTTSNAVLSVAEAGDFDKEQAFSCSVWIKLPEDNMTGAAVARMDDRNGYRGWDLYIDGNRPATHLVNTWPSNAIKVRVKEKLPAGKWNHVVMTYNGSGQPAGLRFYVNGKLADVEIPNKGLTASFRTSVPLKLGQREKESRLNKISLADLRLYDRALKAAEADALVKGTRSSWLIAKGDKRTTEETTEIFDAWLPRFDQPFKEASTKYSSLTAEEAAIKKRGTVAHVFEERKQEPMAYVLFRGEYDKRRDPVLANTPKVLPAFPEDFPRSRLGFAKWLLSPEHPLTARVTVNRFWQEIFGAGIVKTAGDFGVSGEMPSHPDLLDWLAVEFRESGWDTRRLFKLLVTSATYRQGQTVTPEKLQKDPQNRLLSRGPRFRMDAEMIRDYALSASGLLVNKIGGRSVKPYQPPGVWEAVAMPESNTRNYEPEKGDNLYRRSLYTFWKRSAPPASMDIFNAPSRETCTVRRERTDTPLQALVTLNDPQFIEAARRLAERALKSGESTASRIDFVAQRLLARSLRPKEQRVVEDELKDLQAHYEANSADANALLAVGESKADSGLSKAQLAALTMAVNQMMNLDEVLNK